MLPTHLIQKLSKIQNQRSQKENDGFSTLTVILLVIAHEWFDIKIYGTKVKQYVHLGKIVFGYFTLL